MQKIHMRRYIIERDIVVECGIDRTRAESERYRDKAKGKYIAENENASRASAVSVVLRSATRAVPSSFITLPLMKLEIIVPTQVQAVM